MPHVFLARARAAFEQGNYAAARKTLETIVAGPKADATVATGMLALQNRMAAMIRQLQMRADTSIRNGEAVQTTRAYLRLLSVAGNQPSSAKARTWLQAARKRPGMAGALREGYAAESCSNLLRQVKVWRKTQTAPQGGKLHLKRRQPVTEVQELLAGLKDLPPGIQDNVRARLLKIAKAYVGTPTANKIAAGLQAAARGAPQAATGAARGAPAARKSRSLRLD